MRPHTRKIKRDPLDNLWKLFDDWAEDYARANGVDKEAVITAIAGNHRQLSMKINESVAGLSRITGTSQEVTAMARHIADAAREQAVASGQVASNMEKIANLIDGNLASAQEAKQAADTLNATALELRRVVRQFRVV